MALYSFSKTDSVGLIPGRTNLVLEGSPVLPTFIVASYVTLSINNENTSCATKWPFAFSTHHYNKEEGRYGR